MESNSKRLFKNTSIYALGDIIPKLFAFIIFPIYTRNISPDEYGIIDYINTIDTFISVLCILSLNTYFLFAYYKEGDEESRKKLFGNLSVFVFVFTVAVTIILHFVGPTMFKSWGSKVDFYPYISLGVLTNLFNIVTLLPTCLYRVQERPMPLTILNVIKSTCILVGSTLAVTWMNGAAYEVLLVRLILSVFFAFAFIYSTKQHIILNVNAKQLWKALKFALPLVPGAMAYYLFNIFDRVLIDKYLTLTDLGIFSTASSLAMMLNIVSNGAYKAFEPYFFQTYGTSSFNSKFINVRDVLLTIVLIGAFCIGVFSKEFFQIFSGESYHVAYRYVPIILIGAVVYAIALMYETVLIAQQKTIKSTVITFIGATTSIFLNVLYLSKYGIYAASVVLSFSFVLVWVLRVIATRINVPHAKPVLATTASFALLLILVNFWSLDNILFSIIIKILICVLYTYFILKYMKIDVHYWIGIVFNKK